MITESIKLDGQITESVTENNLFFIKGVCLKVGFSRNFQSKLFYTEKALKDGASTLITKPVLINHEGDSIGLVVDSNFSDDKVYFKARVDNQEIMRLIREYKVYYVSIGALAEIDKDMKVTKIIFQELSLLYETQAGVIGAKITDIEQEKMTDIKSIMQNPRCLIGNEALCNMVQKHFGVRWKNTSKGYVPQNTEELIEFFEVIENAKKFKKDQTPISDLLRQEFANKQPQHETKTFGRFEA